MNEALVCCCCLSTFPGKAFRVLQMCGPGAESILPAFPSPSELSLALPPHKNVLNLGLQHFLTLQTLQRRGRAVRGNLCIAYMSLPPIAAGQENQQLFW